MNPLARPLILAVLAAAIAAGPANAATPEAPTPPMLTCTHANGPPDTYAGWVDKQTGAFLFRCLLFGDQRGVAFQMTYRSPALLPERSRGVIGGGWGVDFDDRAVGVVGGGLQVRNGADGSIDVYRPPRRGDPLLVFGDTPDQRQRRKAACEYADLHDLDGARRVYCDRTIQHFDDQGRLARYSTHAFRQVFTLDWTPAGLAAVEGFSPEGKPVRVDFRRAEGRLTASDQNGRTVVLDFDRVGRLVRAESSAGQIYAFAYDDAANLARVMLVDGVTQTMTYDAQVRIVRIETSTGAEARFLYHPDRTEILERAADGSKGKTVVRWD